MLTKQGGRLEQSLIEGGLNPLAANAAMAAVGNCSQTLDHRGPISLDYTPKEFRFVTPMLRKFRFGNMDNVDGDMPRKRQQEKKPPEKPPQREDHPPEQQENVNVRRQFDPLYGGSGGITGIVAGPYIKVEGRGSTARVSLNGGGNVGDIAVFQANQVVGATLAIRSSLPKVLTVQNPETLQYQLVPKGEYLDVVTDVRLTDRTLTVVKRNCFVFDPLAEQETDYDHKLITYVDNVTLDADTLKFERLDAYVVGGEVRAADPVEINIVDCEA
jgi:hypothetical protein